MKRVLATTLGMTMALVVSVLLFKYSFYLAAMRVYDADECENVFTARILATGQTKDFAATASLYHLPLMWLARGATQSSELFASARIASLLIFWLNLLLIALATGERLKSWKWLAALLGAATLAPLWDFGFEIRPENLLLTGLLLIWCAVRPGGAGIGAYAVAGGLAGAMQFTAPTAWLYIVPLTIVLPLFAPGDSKRAWWKLALAWGGGAVGMFAVIRAGFGFAGIWDSYRTGWVSDTSSSALNMWEALTRLMIQSPLLVALLLAGLIAVVLDWWRRGRALSVWGRNFPEAVFVLAVFAVMLVPASEPGGLLVLVAFAFLFVFRYAGALLKQVWSEIAFRPVIVALLVFAHGVPFVQAVKRHREMLNFRQSGLMELAEHLTDPAKDRVFDGIGMVPTRASIQYDWSLQMPIRPQSTKESAISLQESLSRRPPTVIIANYRTDWLSVDAHRFIEEHYVPLADDFWVLGKKLPSGGGTFEIIHPGRYQIRAKEASWILGTIERNSMGLALPPTKTNCVGTLDGQPLTAKAVELTVGTHRIETTPDCEPAVVWLGPKLEQLRALGDKDHRWLFVNWY